MWKQIFTNLSFYLSSSMFPDILSYSFYSLKHNIKSALQTGSINPIQLSGGIFFGKTISSVNGCSHLLQSMNEVNFCSQWMQSISSVNGWSQFLQSMDEVQCCSQWIQSIALINGWSQFLQSMDAGNWSTQWMQSIVAVNGCNYLLQSMDEVHFCSQ